MKTMDSKTLTVRQKYLLDRLPRRYDLNVFSAPPEPPNVKAARRLIDSYEKRIGKMRCVATKRSEALLRKAQEAVYFSTEEKALAIIVQVEKMLKKCGE